MSKFNKIFVKFSFMYIFFDNLYALIIGSGCPLGKWDTCQFMVFLNIQMVG